MAWTFNKPVFRPDSIPTNLVAYWKFNNDATDSSGKGYTLTAGADAAAPTFVATDYWKSGEYSTEFTASDNEYYTLTRNADVDCLNAFSIVGWIYADDITSVAIVDKDSAGNGYGVQLDGSSKLVLNMNNGARATSGTAVAAGRWTHFACVYDQATARVYLDGNLENSAAYTTDCADEAVDFRLGSLADGSLDYDGKLKDLAVWSAALTPLQIKSLALGVDLSKYAYRPNHVSTQPTHWWRLNEVSGDRADSVATNPLTLTDNGGTLASVGYTEGVGMLGATADYLTHAGDDDFAFGTGDFSISLWMKTSTSASFRMIDIGGDTDGHNYALFPTTSTGAFILYTGATNLKSFATPFRNNGAFYHFAMKRASGTIGLYIDGILCDTVDDSTNISDNNFWFNAWQSVTNAGLVGNFQDLAIWKGYALTDAEIKSLACALPIQRQGIVLYSKMDTASGNETTAIGSYTLVDSGGTGTGTGQVNGARDFNKATPDSLTVALASQGDLNITTDMTAFCWIKPETSTATGTIIDNDIADCYSLTLASSNVITATIDSTSDVSTATIADSAFGHAAMVWDGAKVYAIVNGVWTAGTAKTTIVTSDADFVIGARSDGSTTPFDGLIDEVVVAKRYFRPEEIKAAYLKGLNAKEVTTVERPIGNNSQVIWFD